MKNRCIFKIESFQRNNYFYQKGKTFLIGLIILIFFSNPSFGNNFFIDTYQKVKDKISSYTLMPGCIDGKVFNDVNCNGVDDSEGGIEGVQISIFDCSNNLVDSTYTNINGNWQICDLTDGVSYRIEFLLADSINNIYNPTHNGMDNGTNVQFATPNNTINFGLTNPADYCEDAAFLLTPCYIYGDNTGNEETLVRWSYENTGLAPLDKTPITTAVQAASMWGMGYNAQSGKLYSAAVLKRHAGLYNGAMGDGLDIIFEINPFLNSPNALPWIELEEDLGIDVGDISSNTARGLNTSPNNDPEAFGKAGKVGIGDIEVSEDGQTLFVMNLFDKTVYLIDIPSKSLITSYSVPDPGCTNGTYRPWALALHNGELFVGSVCDGSSVAPSPPTITDETARPFLEAFVYKLTNGSFTQILNFPLDYQREAPFAYSSGTCTSDIDGWYGWVDELQVECEVSSPQRIIAYPQPILSDIEFDENSNMILGFIDRTGLQIGANNYGPTGTDLYSMFSGGEILFACNNGSDNWTLENAVNCTNSNGEAMGTTNNTYPGYVFSNGWPNIGEYFVGDFFHSGGDINSPDYFPGHAEITIGGLAYKPGENEIVSTAFDPVTGGPYYSRGGVIKLSTVTGRRSVQGFELYNSDADNNATAGKGVGLGDLELVCSTPLEIGNYVWCDSLQNGIQDACERGIDNIIVQLYDRNGNLVGQDTTSNSGQYYFNENNIDTTGITINGSGIASPVTSWSGMSYSTQYFIIFGGGQFATNEFIVNGETYGITSMPNAGSNDNIDSDVDGSNLSTAMNAMPAGLPFIDITTSPTGCGDHKYDMGVTCTEPCQLTISYNQTNCTDNNDGTFTANYDLTLSWQSRPATGGLTLTHYGNGTLNTTTVSAATIAASNSTTLSNALTVPANGSGNTGILAVFDNDLACKDSIGFKAPTPCPNDVTPCAATSGCIGGNVFEDFNCNGTDDTNEPGVQGIEVQVYDCNNNLVGTGYSDSDGDWQVCSLTDGIAYRIEHVLPETVACWATPTHVGNDNGSDIQFLTAPACTQFSVSSPADYCGISNPDLVTTCFVAGDPLAPGFPSGGPEDAIVSIDYDFTGTVDHDATSSETGSVWGLAINRKLKRVFSAAFTKRHVGFGSLGQGGIYVSNYNNNPVTTTPFIDLGNFYNVGSAPSNSARGLTANPTDPSIDQYGWDNVGKSGLGDLEISDDDNTMFVVNLAEKKVIKIDLTSYNQGGTIPSAGEISTLPDYPQTECDNGTDRPFGLGLYRNQLFLGVICDASDNGSINDLTANVYQFDLTTENWTMALSFPLDFQRGYTHRTSCEFWMPWTEDENDLIVSQTGFEGRCWPQPLLSDIEFDIDGSMILGFADKGAHMLGAANRTPNDPTNIFGVSGGDLMRAAWTGTQYIIESGGTTVNGGGSGIISPTPNSPDDSPGLPQGQGPDNGEYYSGDFFQQHAETSLGGVTLLNGRGEVAIVAIDPERFESGGWNILNNNTGTNVVSKELYASFGAPGTFGKGAGLGDAEVICAPAPLEIGNYVWCDSIQNGIQDACERGIDDIIVQLYDRNGNLVGQDTTSNSGQYYFNQNNVDTTGITIDGSGIASPVTSWSGMSYSTQYFIVFGDGQFATDEFTVGGETYGITSMANAGSNDNIDSDVDGSNLSTTLNARPAGLPFIDITTGPTGCGDHKYDMGVTCTVPCQLIISYNQINCTDNSDGTFTAAYDLTFSWQSPPATGDLTLTHYGNGTLNTTTVSAATIAGSNSTTLSNVLTVPADGNGNTGILATFDNDLTCKDSIGFKAPTPCPNDVTPCTATSGCIGGNVFEDFNCNGTDDTNEPGVQGIEVQIYDCNNNLVGTGYSDNEGDWQVCGLTDGTAYRVEFLLNETLECWATPTHVGSDNMSDVQFLTAPACTQFSVSSSADYCQENPQVSLACYESGSGANNSNKAYISFNQDDTGIPSDFGGTASNPIGNVQIQQIGSVWGAAYKPIDKTLFTASFLKRHVGFGPTGPGGVYLIDYSNSGGNLIGSFNLQGVTPNNGGQPIDLGTINRTNIIGPIAGGAAGDYQMPDDPIEPNRDLDAFTKVGTMSFGDIDISEDGNTLWLINIFQNSLISIDISDISLLPNDGSSIPANLVNTFPIEDAPGVPNCIGGKLRPWGLKISKGRAYVGIVCDASNSTTDNLDGMIVSFDVNTPGNFNHEFSFDLDYPRESIIHAAEQYPDGNMDGDYDIYYSAPPLEWQPWLTTSVPGDIPQPIISDIEFDNDGNMILGIADRLGHMTGNEQYFAQSGATNLVSGTVAGDILKACKNNGSWTIDCGPINDTNTSIAPFSNGSSITDSPGGNGEFFYEDYFYNLVNEFSEVFHWEITTGGLAFSKQNHDVVTTVYDPIGSNYGETGSEDYFRTQGIHWYASSNGSRTNNYMIVPASNDAATYGKGNGLGDPELLCNPAPLEIGNYVWCDSIQNGIQDACERGIDDIIVQLYDRNGNLIGQDTTSNSGQYYFNQNNVDTTGITIDGSGIASPVTSWSGMSYSTQYFIVFGSGQFAADEFTVGSESYGITSMTNAGSNDNIDSDVNGNNLSAAMNAMPAGLPFIDMTTSPTGCGDHKYDLGVTCEPVCSISNADLMSITCNDNNTIGDPSDDYLTFTLNPSGENLGAAYFVSVNSGTITPANANYGVTTTFQLQNGSAGAGNVTVTITDGNDIGCSFNVLITDPGSCGQNVDFPDYMRTSLPPCDETPCHVVNTDLMLGMMISADAMEMSDSTATSDDDDGITFPNNLRLGTQIRLQIQVTNNTGNDAHVYGWADWNNDGDFDDANEAFLAATYDNATYNGVYTVSEPIFIPSDANHQIDGIAMRFRVSSAQNAVNNPCGPVGCAPDGEVEDYLIQLECPPTICLPVNTQINRD